MCVSKALIGAVVVVVVVVVATLLSLCHDGSNDVTASVVGREFVPDVGNVPAVGRVQSEVQTIGQRCTVSRVALL